MEDRVVDRHTACPLPLYQPLCGCRVRRMCCACCACQVCHVCCVCRV
jgi:hypothetical protein